MREREGGRGIERQRETQRERDRETEKEYVRSPFNFFTLDN